MSYITIGSLITSIIKEQKVERKSLVKGICSTQTLSAIEKDQGKSDPFMIEVLLQRMGKSPDKLEQILDYSMYRMVRMRDLLEQTICRGKHKFFMVLWKNYPNHTRIDQMYRYRMLGWMQYRIEKDYEKAEESLNQAVLCTLPEFTYERMENYLISTVEMENLLALVQVRLTQKKEKRSDVAEEKLHLEQCMVYIDKHFTDEEEHTKICSKCAWLLAGIYYEEKNYYKAMDLCQKGMEGLRKNTMLYFMLPLLQLAVKITTDMGIPVENNKYVKYEEILNTLHREYAPKWYPVEDLFHNCYQKEYHLDYELIRAEREFRKIRRDEILEGAYENLESYSRFETGKASPNKSTYETLMEKMQMNKGRYQSAVITESFHMMEIRRQMNILFSRGEYEKAEGYLERLKEELDLSIEENQKVIRNLEIMLDTQLGRMSYEQAVTEQKKLLSDLYDFDKNQISHIPMRNEVSIINSLCIRLEKIGRTNEANRIEELVLSRIQGSRVHVKYRYRSYALLLGNQVDDKLDAKTIQKCLKNEILCGKAGMLHNVIANYARWEQKKGFPESECFEKAKWVYYVSDLFYMEFLKKAYKEYLERNKVKLIS